MSQEAGSETHGSGHVAGGHVRTPDAEKNAQLADRIVQRFGLEKGQEDIFDLINQKAYYGGILLAGLVLFWWVLITEGNDDITLATSFLFDMNFSNVAITVGLFGLISSSFKSLSREKGQLLPSLLSGAMLIVCGFFMLFISIHVYVPKLFR